MGAMSDTVSKARQCTPITIKSTKNTRYALNLLEPGSANRGNISPYKHSTALQVRTQKVAGCEEEGLNVHVGAFDYDSAHIW